MQSYKRKITYFYEFHNGNIGTTAGFLKLEIRGDKVKIIINIQSPVELPYEEASLYFYHEAGDHLAALKVDKVEIMDGILTYHNRTDWKELFDTGRDLYTFDGVAVVYTESHYYIGDFQDRNRENYELVLKEEKKETIKPIEMFFPKQEETIAEKRQAILRSEIGELLEKSDVGQREEIEGQRERTEEKQSERQREQAEGKQLESRRKQTEEKQLKGQRKQAEEKQLEGQRKNEEEIGEVIVEKEEMREIHTKEQKDVFEECEHCPYRKKREEKKEPADEFEKMLKEYPKLPMYGVTELFDCVRIMPKDIGKLDMRNWKLGVNSFLTHGFYTYQYLLLGKMRFGDGTERPIIGVPGVFSNREKYLANMFGFEQFIPIKKMGVRTGAFGYWIVEINPYL